MQPRLVPILLLALLLAGCAQPAATKAPSAAPPAPAGDPFHPRQASGSADLKPPAAQPDVPVATPGFAEPNVAAGYDGKTLYVGNPGDVWRSDDGGKTWQHPGNAGLEGGGDGDVAVDRNGTVYYLGLLGKEGRTIPFLASHDRGETWSKAVDLAEGGGKDREWIDVTPEGGIAATWRGKTGIEFNGSPDGGASWRGKVTVGPDGDGGPVVHDPVTGALAIPVVDQAATTGTDAPVVHVYVSNDSGKTWAGHDTANL